MHRAFKTRRHRLDDGFEVAAFSNDLGVLAHRHEREIRRSFEFV
jgi:hypothetical protein